MVGWIKLGDIEYRRYKLVSCSFQWPGERAFFSSVSDIICYE